jgi:hypothetical protein
VHRTDPIKAEKAGLQGLVSNIRLQPGMATKAGLPQERLCLKSPKHLRIPM